MPRSMRSVSAQIKKRDCTREAAKKVRETAHQMLLGGRSNAEIMRLTSITNGTLSRLKIALRCNNQEQLDKLLDTHNFRPGPPTRLSSSTETRIKEHLKKAALFGFAVGVEGVRDIAARIDREDKNPFRNNRPSPEWVREFRARHRDITLRAHEDKEIAKLHAENMEHITTLKKALQKVVTQHPNIAHDPRLVWNFDETEVTGEFGEATKDFSSASRKRGGFRAKAGNGTGNHLTACVIANAAGDVLPPLFVFAGKNIMTRWTEPLPSAVWKDDENNPFWYARDDWIQSAGDIVLRGTENGSMDKATIRFVVDHIREQTRKLIPANEHMLLLLDGHKSRSGCEWLEIARDARIEVVQSPANTTHFLQACDNTINKAFKEEVRRTQDEIASKSLVNFGDMHLKLILGVARFRSLSRSVVSKAFENVGLWPMDFRFAQLKRANKSPIISPKKAPDLLEEMKRAVRSGNSPRAICAGINAVVEEQKSRADLIDSLFSTRSNAIQKPEGNLKQRSVLASGQAAAYLTLPKVIEHRKNEVLRKEADKAAKEKLAKKNQELLSLKKKLDIQLKEVREEERDVRKNNLRNVDAIRKVKQEKSGLVQKKDVEAQNCADILLGLQSSVPPSVGNQICQLASGVGSSGVGTVDAIEAGVQDGSGGFELRAAGGYDESVGDQACLEDDVFCKSYFGQFDVDTAK